MELRRESRPGTEQKTSVGFDTIPSRDSFWKGIPNGLPFGRDNGPGDEKYIGQSNSSKYRERETNRSLSKRSFQHKWAPTLSQSLISDTLGYIKIETTNIHYHYKAIKLQFRQFDLGRIWWEIFEIRKLWFWLHSLFFLQGTWTDCKQKTQGLPSPFCLEREWIFSDAFAK